MTSLCIAFRCTLHKHYCVLLRCFFHILLRSENIELSNNHYITGKPKRMDLLSCEDRVVRESQLEYPTHLFVYSYLRISNKCRTVVSQSCCRATKRNNSCVMYTKNGDTLFGLLNKLVFLKDPTSTLQQCYALIQGLKPAHFFLYHDSITRAQLNNHIIALHPPRFVLNTHILHVHTHTHTQARIIQAHTCNNYLTVIGVYEVVECTQITVKITILLVVDPLSSWVYLNYDPPCSRSWQF